jgi:anti-sigma factor RsiW
MNARKRSNTNDARLNARIRHCLEPEVGALLLSNLMGELAEEDSRKFEEHLRECTKCLADKIRLDAALRILKANPAKFFADPKMIRTRQSGH